MMRNEGERIHSSAEEDGDICSLLVGFVYVQDYS